MTVEEFLEDIMTGQEAQMAIIKNLLSRLEALEKQVKRLEEAHLKMG